MKLIKVCHSSGIRKYEDGEMVLLLYLSPEEQKTLMLIDPPGRKEEALPGIDTEMGHWVCGLTELLSRFHDAQFVKEGFPFWVSLKIGEIPGIEGYYRMAITKDEIPEVTMVWVGGGTIQFGWTIHEERVSMTGRSMEEWAKRFGIKRIQWQGPLPMKRPWADKELQDLK